jgi:plastocyanin
MENQMTRVIAALLAALALAPAARASGGTISGKVEVTPARYLKATVVYLKEVAGSYAPKTVNMDQKGMEFRPHVLIITAGDTVTFLNNDGVDHNVFTTDNEGYNLGMFPKGQSKDYRFANAGTYTQLCSAHPEMLAYIFVGQNPYSAVVDKKGHYKIKDVPPGTYQIAAWNGNSKIKAEDQSVTVEAGKTAQVDFAMAK